MGLCKSTYIVMCTLLLFENQYQLARADATLPSSTSPPVTSGVIASPTVGVEQRWNTLQSDRTAIHEDRSKIRSDRVDIETKHKDIRAVEHDIQINPQNKSTDQARIAADQKSIRSVRQDLMKNAHHLHHDQRALRSAINQEQNLRHSSGSAFNPLFSNGFFPPTQKPASGQNGVTGFGDDTQSRRTHLAR